MKRMILVVFALAAVLVPAALATTPAQAPSVFCKANPSLIGARQDVQEHGRLRREAGRTG